MKKTLVLILLFLSIQSGLASDASVKAPPLDKHILSIRSAITAKFYNAREFEGKKCSIKIHLARDGQVESMSDITGDPGLCDAAKKIINTAKLPRPDSDDIWLKTNNITLDFEP